ncbi:MULTISPECIES: TonB-dependent receptor domain-containing protein [Halomonas]|uniref:TonB-dependent receptor domain-containing protein n=1 Tax=Halomonas TaxID=2745 RepID=UPI001C93D3FC|nr:MULTISPECIES: TonB-dependent receptor [Halomonas]MBY6208948.1 TonB-dependent receptor [Halomonas sp. DP3Y7-2]MBY6227418.1 TonB-dependent receptor [Halomonas sp. DP3Y7-1]MCA0914832.1 TonB-dependent receptor [Halomonas denitrificans]
MSRPATSSPFILQRRTLCSAIALICSSSAVMAQEPLASLAPIQVTADRIGDDEQRVDDDTLRRYQADDLQDIFSGMADVTVGGGGSPVAQKVYVRGLEDTLLNVTVDGATQSGYLFHHQGRLMVEPELLKSVSVSAGPGDATNGPGTLGGAIRFETKDPDDLLRPGESIGGLLKAGYFSNTDGYKASASLFGRINDDWSAMATLVDSDHDDYEDGDGNTQPFTGTELQSGFAKVVGQLTDEQRIAISYERSEDEAYRKHRPHWVPSVRNPVFDQEMVRETITGKYRFNSLDNDWLDLEFTVYDTDASLEHIDGPYGTYLGELDSYGADLRNTSYLGDHTLTYGIDYRHDEGSLNSDTETGSVTGLYIQNDYHVTDRLTLSAGTRYDWYELDENGTGQSFDESGFSPNLGVSFDATEQLNLYGGWARAIRGTQVKELFVLDYYRNAEDRKEETSDNYEVGAIYRQGNLYVSGEAFITKIDDVVGQEGYTGVLNNIGELETRGFTAKIGYDWERVSASIAYSQSSPELNGEPLNDDNFSLGTSVGDSWIANLNYQATDSLDIGWSSRFTERLTDVADGYSEKAGFAVHDVYAQWQPLSDDQLTLSLTVNNLLDKQYYDHASYAVYGDVAAGLPEAGRDIRANVAYRF